jgi:hypothetical protein
MGASYEKRISDPQAEPERVSESQTFVTADPFDLSCDEGLALLLFDFSQKLIARSDIEYGWINRRGDNDCFLDRVIFRAHR